MFYISTIGIRATAALISYIFLRPESDSAPGSARVLTSASPTRTITVAGSFEKLCHRNVQCAGEFLDALYGRVAFSTLQIRNVGAMQARSFGKFSL